MINFGTSNSWKAEKSFIKQFPSKPSKVLLFLALKHQPKKKMSDADQQKDGESQSERLWL